MMYVVGALPALVASGWIIAWCYRHQNDPAPSNFQVAFVLALILLAVIAACIGAAALFDQSNWWVMTWRYIAINIVILCVCIVAIAIWAIATDDDYVGTTD